jgi:F0F1-type ATP synthase membrane subunit b/b'
MNPAQFWVLIGTVVVVGVLVALGIGLLIAVLVPRAVERSVKERWQNIEDMLARALSHGGSLDTFNRQSRAEASAARETAAGAVKAVELLKDRVDHHDRRLRALEEHPLLRPLGGPARPPL